MNKIDEIIKWASGTKFSAHDVFDDMNDNSKIIKAFYADECPKDQSGIVLTLHDAELLAYEYARRLIEKNKPLKTAKIVLNTLKDPDAWRDLSHELLFEQFRNTHPALEDAVLNEKFYKEIIYKKFRCGEYANIELEIDENFNVVGGKIF